ncbi:MAG: hypothetical protein AAFW69_06495 [Pseudomonadota bacterium]
MRTVLRYLLYLVLLALLGVVGYAFVAELPPPSRDVERAIELPDGG